MEWGIAYYHRPDGTVPAEAVLDGVHYRLFCVLENGTPDELERRGFDRPQIVVIAGMCKRNATVFLDRDYKTGVRDLGDRYLSTLPRPVAE